MSMLDDFFGICLSICCGCCCLSCSQTGTDLWCLLKSGGETRYRVQNDRGGCCSCKRAMTDDDFERTVEQLYADGKPIEFPSNNRKSQHVELQPVHSEEPSGSGSKGEVSTQPAPRPSMEARPQRSRSRVEHEAGERAEGGDGDEEDRGREKEMQASRKGAKARTREWVAGQGSSVDISTGALLSDADADVTLASGAPRAHQQRPSDSQLHLQAQRSQSQSRAHRPHQSESQALAQAYLQRPPAAHAPRSRPSSPYDQQGVERGRHSPDTPPPGGLGVGTGKRQPRLDVPAALMPGRPQSSAPTQLPFDAAAVLGQYHRPLGAQELSAHSQVGELLESGPPVFDVPTHDFGMGGGHDAVGE